MEKTWSAFYNKSQQWLASPRGSYAKKIAEQLLIWGLIAFLVYQLWGIEFNKLLGSLPLNPIFYGLILFQFFVVPVSEYFIYQLKWSFKGVVFLKAFIIKKIYNNELYNYTGEVYFSRWIANKLVISQKEAGLFVKDNNIVSSLASTLIAFLTLFIISYLGYFDLLNWISGFDRTYLVVGIILLTISLFVGYKFRNKIVHLKKGLFVKLFSWYVVRFIIRHYLLMVMWSVAAPDISWLVWVNFLTVQILIDRLPLGNKSLILLSIAPTLSTTFNVGVEVFTGIQLVFTLFDKLLGVITLLWSKQNVQEKVVTQISDES
jgi:hypothetical protein